MMMGASEFTAFDDTKSNRYTVFCGFVFNETDSDLFEITLDLTS